MSLIQAQKKGIGYDGFGSDAVGQHELQQVQIGNMLDLTELPGSAINSRSTAPSQKTHMVQRLHDGTAMRSPIGQENLHMRNGL